MSEIKENSKAQVHYTGRYSDGEVFDSSKLVEGTAFTDREPLDVELGIGRMIPGFEKALLGMKIGDSKNFTVPAVEAYGEHYPERVQEIEKQYVPEGVVVGEMLTAQGPMGPMTCTVTEIKENTVVIDGNHPLAGKDLTFDIEVVSIS